MGRKRKRIRRECAVILAPRDRKLKKASMVTDQTLREARIIQMKKPRQRLHDTFHQKISRSIVFHHHSNNNTTILMPADMKCRTVRLLPVHMHDALIKT